MKELIIVLLILLFAVYGVIQGVRTTLLNILKLINKYKNQKSIERGQPDVD